MKLIVWGIISTIIALFWGIIERDSIMIIGGITIGIMTCLHYMAVKKESK